MDIEQMRHEAALLMAEIRPLRERLRALQQKHAGLAWDIEMESRRQTAIKHIARGVSGQTKPVTKRNLNPAHIIEQFKNLPVEAQAKLVAQLAKTV